MLDIYQVQNHHLLSLLSQPVCSEIDGLILLVGEEIAPPFVLERMQEKLSQDPDNSFWWLPWFVVVDKLVVGMCSFINASPRQESVCQRWQHDRSRGW
jgi:hypothetical protein